MGRRQPNLCGQRKSGPGKVPGRPARLARRSAVARHGARPQLWHHRRRARGVGRRTQRRRRRVRRELRRRCRSREPAAPRRRAAGPGGAARALDRRGARPHQDHQCRDPWPRRRARTRSGELRVRRRRLPSAPGTAGPWYEGGLSAAAHSEYWEDGSPSLRSFGRIIAGKPA